MSCGSVVSSRNHRKGNKSSSKHASSESKSSHSSASKSSSSNHHAEKTPLVNSSGSSSSSSSGGGSHHSSASSKQSCPSPKSILMSDIPGLPRYCFGSTAVFIIVFCLLCSLSTLGPKLIETMVQNQQSMSDRDSNIRDIDTSTCRLQQLSAPEREVQASFLTSYPGSGARLMSRLVEALSGIPTTDDVYSNGVTNTVGINTYYPCPEGQETPGADSIRRAAILIRHPLDAIPAYHNLLYQQMNNAPVAPEDDWSVWSTTKLLTQIDVWSKHLEYWVDRYPTRNRLVVSYDQLLSPLRGPKVANELADFFSFSQGINIIPPKDIPCVWQRLVDEYELTLPLSERRKRIKRPAAVVPRQVSRDDTRGRDNYRDDRSELRSDDYRGNRKEDKRPYEDDRRSNRRGGDDHNDYDDQRGGKKLSYRDTDQRGDDRDEEQSYGRSSPQQRNKSMRLGGRGDGRSKQRGESDYGKDQGQEEEAEKPASFPVATKSRKRNRDNGEANQDVDEGGQNEEEPQVSEEGRGQQQNGGRYRQPVSETDQQQKGESEASNEESTEETQEEGSEEGEEEGAEQDSESGGDADQVEEGGSDGSDNEEQSSEVSTERRGSAQEVAQANTNRNNARGGGGGGGADESGEGNSEERLRLRRRRLSQIDVAGIFDQRHLQNQKIFPVEGRKELLIQLSRLLEKYHGDENIAGILVEYIDELERRHPTN